MADITGQRLFIFTTLILFFSSVQQASGIQCYVCSWSPSESYRIDVCTKNNFSASVLAHTCEHGCEATTVYDKNGNIEIFYRNCASKESPITGDCKNETKKAITKNICTCDSDYCNSANLLQLSPFLTLLVALAMAW